jgi:hypothetical protein
MKRKTLFPLLCLIAAGFFVNLHAQRVLWTLTSPGYPSIDAVNAGVFSEEFDLNLHFQIVGGALNSGKLKLDLPAGIALNSIAPNGGAAVTLDIASLTPPATGTVEIPFSSITYNAEIRLQAKLQAIDCEQTGLKTIPVSILSGGNAIQLDGLPGTTSKSAAVTVLVPNIVASVNNANPPTLSELKQPHTYTVTLSVSNGVSAKDMKLEILKRKYTVLSDFLLGGDPIPSIAIALMDSLVTLELTPDILGAPISGTSTKTLSFTAKSSIGGSLPITGKSIYPLAGNCGEGVRENLFELTLAYPPVTGGGMFEVPARNGVFLTTHPETNVINIKKKHYLCRKKV